MKNTTAIKILIEMEAEASRFLQRVTHARKMLEKVEGSSPAPEREKGLNQAEIIEMNSRRRKRIMKS